MRGHFLFLKNTVGTPTAMSHPPKGHGITVLEQPEFSADALNGMTGLLLGQHLDEHHLRAFRPTLDAYLEGGGAVATMGPIAQPFLSILHAHKTVGEGRKSDWMLQIANDHPIVAGVAAPDLSLRKGVVGFWARGTITPPKGAVILTFFTSSGDPADWAWQGTGGGKLFVHPGNDVWGYAAEPNSSARVFPQLLDWMAA